MSEKMTPEEASKIVRGLADDVANALVLVPEWTCPKDVERAILAHAIQESRREVGAL